MEEKEQGMQFQRWSSAVDVSFWHALKAKKLDVLKVEDMPLPIRGSYVPAAGTKAENGSLMFLDFSAFDIESELPYGAVSCPGTLINVNTLEDFKKMDRKAILFQYGKLILEDIRSGRSSSKPSLLCRFILTTFADLKSHKFHYWFAFPVLKGFKFTLVQPSTLFSDAFSDDQICFFHQMFEDWSKKESKGEYGITPVQISKDLCHIVSWEHFGAHKTSDLFIAFVDASSNSKAPSWNLRNALVMSSMVYNVKQVRVICIRNLTDMRSSMIFHVRTDGEIVDTPDFSGWEPASTGRLTSRVIDLSALLDPIELAKSSVTLNIRLMRWRLMPSLQVDEIANTKCLLLGAGTLGCAVAQVLLGWGVKTISFVDNGRVSYSNPVRQFLYDFKDCQDGGRWKVEAAAERLIEIFPGSNPSAHVLSIPMPGHPIPESEMDKFLNDFERLCKLIQSHDVIFLLTDSRESRWLPTVLCTAHKKPLINTALGFDTFQVIRSGQGIDCPERLGCSFCSDVCAPSDSITDRTLDMQCTVTRPGIAPLAAAVAVELMINLLHHPLKHDAPASPSIPVSQDVAGLGSLPHIIRGYLSHFQNLVLTGSAFPYCSACSPAVINLYHEQGREFVLKVLSSTKYLEEACGLTAHLASVEDDIQWDEDEMLCSRVL